MIQIWDSIKENETQRHTASAEDVERRLSIFQRRYVLHVDSERVPREQIQEHQSLENSR